MQMNTKNLAIDSEKRTQQPVKIILHLARLLQDSRDLPNSQLENTLLVMSFDNVPYYFLLLLMLAMSDHCAA